MLLIWGLRVFYHTIGKGTFHCPQCGGDRHYRHRAGRRFFTLFFIPIIPLNKTGEHVQCLTCKIRYVTDALSRPTSGRMQAALPAGMRAAATAMLVAGDRGSTAARRRAVAAIQGAGARDYSDAHLDPDAAQPAEAAQAELRQVGRQLTPDAKEWFLAEVVRVGIADGPLSDSERQAAEMIALDLGMSQAQAVGVVTLAERAARQN